MQHSPVCPPKAIPIANRTKNSAMGTIPGLGVPLRLSETARSTNINRNVPRNYKNMRFYYIRKNSRSYLFEERPSIVDNRRLKKTKR